MSNKPLTTKEMSEWNEKTWNKCQEEAWAEPLALRLAEWLERSSNGPLDARHEAAAKLRRLHAECEHHKSWVAHITAENKLLEAQRDALLEALKAMLTHMGMDEDEWSKPTFNQARAAIAKAEEA